MEISAQLSDIKSSLPFLLPELLLVAVLLLLILSDLIFPKKPKLLYYFTYAGLLFALILPDFLPHTKTADKLLLGGMLRSTTEIVRLKQLLDFSTLAAMLLYRLDAHKTRTHKRTRRLSGIAEECVLWLGLLLGTHGIVMANHWISLYLSLELASLTAYALTIFRFDAGSAKAAGQYLILGAFASAIMLYGISWVYGLTGSLSFVFPLPASPQILLQIGFLLACAGLLFKIAALPFHLWITPVYRYASAAVVAFFSVVPKFAALYALFFLFQSYQNLFPAETAWLILGVVGVVTITWGNLSALRTQNTAGLMAYSSVAHAGLFLLGICAVPDTDFGILLFYFKAYLPMNLIIFAAMAWYTPSRQIESFSGLGKTSPWIGLALLVAAFALTGLPPTAGFTAKLLIFIKLWDKYTDSNQVLFLVFLIIGVINTVISLFYYLKILYFLFFKDAQAGSTALKPTPVQRIFLGILAGLLLIFFFFPPNEG